MSDAVVVHVLPADGLTCGYDTVCAVVADCVFVVIGKGFSATPLCGEHYRVAVDTVAQMITSASGKRAA